MTPPHSSVLEEGIKEFDKRFTRKSKGLENKGQYVDRWFVRETTAKDLKDFIRSLAFSIRKETIKEVRVKVIGFDEEPPIAHFGTRNDLRVKQRSQLRKMEEK